MKNKYEEQIFCKNYEISILKGIAYNAELERWVPGICHEYTEKEHLARYQWVTRYCNKKNIIDIACGAGYGSHIMRKIGNARSVLGVDIDTNTVKYARYKYGIQGVTYKVGNAENFRPKIGEADLIVSFETIEHLNNQESFLKSVVTGLQDHGLFIVSTPVGKPDLKSDNKYHVGEMTPTQMQKLLQKHFAKVTGYTQYSSYVPSLSLRTGFKKLTKYEIYQKKKNQWGDYQIWICEK